MTAFLRGLYRNWTILNPPTADKREDALNVGILGAANIAPMALITPARSHPEVVVHAVAARDKQRATAFAKKHGIPVVKDSYDAILDDPAIDIVYIPLPSGLHYEWALKALARGKHVLLEKPSTSNAQQAEALFRHARPGQPPRPPVLMEAFHSRFTPAWRLFLSALDPPNVARAVATAHVPAFVVPDGDIRFDYALGGGALLDLGTYPVAALRAVFAAEPTACAAAELTPMAPPRDRCDHTFRARLCFPNGGVGEVDGTMRAPNTQLALPRIEVLHRPVAAPEHAGEGASSATRTRKVTFRNFMFAPHYHSITIEDEFHVTLDGAVTQQFTTTDTKCAYTFREMGEPHPGEAHWSTYRHMLEQFVNAVKGREGSGLFITPEDSIGQARALDMIYSTAGLGPRPGGVGQA